MSVTPGVSVSPVFGSSGRLSTTLTSTSVVQSQQTSPSVFIIPTNTPSTTAAGVFPSGASVNPTGSGTSASGSGGVVPSGTTGGHFRLARRSVRPDTSADPQCTSSQTVVGSQGGTSYPAPTPTEADNFGIQYQVQCHSWLDGQASNKFTHADDFEKCLTACSIFDGCAGITYKVPINAVDSNCQIFTSIKTPTAFAFPQNAIAAVPVAGPQVAGCVGDENLCTESPSYDGKPYTDIFGRTYNIGCDKNTNGGAGNTYLSSTVFGTLDECLTYCSIYDTCIGVDYTGPYTQSTAGAAAAPYGNCFPFSSVGTTQAGIGNSYALLQ